jgi:hypothetical protein
VHKLWLSVYLPSFLIAAGQQAVLVLLALRGLGSLVSNVPAGILVSRFGDQRPLVGAVSSWASGACWATRGR